MRWLVVIGVLLAACERDPEPAVEARPVLNHELPTWAPLPLPKSTFARPKAWISDGRPTLLLFSASWCPTCPASLLTDIALAREYGDKFQIGIGLVENTDEDFARAPMASLLSDVPVWNAESVRTFASRCGAAIIPMACLVDRGRVLFRGSVGHARHMLDAYTAGGVEAALAADAASRAGSLMQLAIGGELPALVKATHRDPSWQIRLALQLASRKETSPTDAAVAVALARDAVATEGGLDYSHLDTYALALSKSNLPDEAAAVGWRVLYVCKTVSAECMIERRRAYLYIYYARERVK